MVLPAHLTIHLQQMESRQYTDKEHKVSRTPHAQTQPQTSAGCEEILMLADFIKKYKHLLPLRIKVVEGFCGPEERYVHTYYSLLAI